MLCANINKCTLCAYVSLWLALTLTILPSDLSLLVDLTMLLSDHREELIRGGDAIFYPLYRPAASQDALIIFHPDNSRPLSPFSWHLLKGMQTST